LSPKQLDHELVDLDREQRASIRVLVVDDEHSLRQSCASLLESEGFQVTAEGDGDRALEMLRQRRYDILLLDLYMTRVSGLDLLAVAKEVSPESIVIIMTGNPSVETSVKALRQGAWDYLPKPFSATHFQVLIGRAAHAVVVARESDERAGDSDSDDDFQARRSERFRELLDVARRVARTDASVFITGESGAGKEMLARYIHDQSRRRSRPLISVNCAAIPEALVESEMFGHVEGAFTGAVRDKEGLLEAANGGTLFLDELTELPLSTQAKLLRVLQDGVVRRVGSVTTDAVVNVRVIAATNTDPLEAIRAGRFRKDLYYRLRVVPMHVPALRECREDIAPLARRFVEEFWANHRPDDGAAPTFSEEAIAALERAPLRGNVRELRNIMEHLVVLAAPGSEIVPEDLDLNREGAGAMIDGALSFDSVLDFGYHEARDRVLREFEAKYLDHVVATADGNISDAARIAGVDRTTLYRLMEKRKSYAEGEESADS
jgi:DNA-binding NtrC family response regulator